MITYRKLSKDDNILLKKLISNEGIDYEEFLNIGWSARQIINQLIKNTNFSYGAFYNESLVFLFWVTYLILKKYQNMRYY